MTKWQIFKYYLKPRNIYEAIINGIFKVELFLSPKKRRALELYMDEFEYRIYRYSVLDNCTCKKVMDKDNKYIESITEPDVECYTHNDDWGD